MDPVVKEKLNVVKGIIKRTIFGRPSIAKLLCIVIIGVSLTLGYNLLLLMLQSKGLVPASRSVEALYSMPKINLVLLSLIWAPVMEELIFRGLLFMLIRYLVGYRTAAFISAVAFAVYHMDPVQGAYAFVFSFALIGIVMAYGDLFSAVLLHFVANASAILLSSYEVFEYFLNSFTHTVLLIAACIILGNGLLLILYLKNFLHFITSRY